MNEWTLTALIGVGLTAGLFPLLLLMLRRPARPGDPADLPQDLPEEFDDREPEPILGGLTDPFASQVPMRRAVKNELQQELFAAGFYHRSALAEYRAIRTVLILAPLLIAGAAALLVEPQQVTRVLFFGVLLAGLGFSLPRVYLNLCKRARGRQIARGLPLAIDLLILCLSAGQNLLAALKQVARELRFSQPALSQELMIAQRQAELHSVDVAMKQWADRVQVPEVNNVAMLLIQSEKLGTDTAGTLVELANNFRTTARQRAETHANRTSFWMLFPSVACFWVASALILIGPAYLEFFQYRQRVPTINQTRRNVDRANRVVTAPTDPNAPAQP